MPSIAIPRKYVPLGCNRQGSAISILQDTCQNIFQIQESI